MLRTRDVLAQSDGLRADVDRLASLVHEMDELFLLVVVGEYNSGKGYVHQRIARRPDFALGDLPTTRAISILRYGKASPPEPPTDTLDVGRLLREVFSKPQHPKRGQLRVNLSMYEQRWH